MKKRNKTYMLFLYGMWISEDELVTAMRDILLPVVDSGFLKFVHGPASAITTFKSQESMDDIIDYLSEHMPDYVTNYVFLPKPRKMGYRLPGSMDKHLFELETDTNDLVQKQMDEEKKIMEDLNIKFNDIDMDSVDKIMGKIDEMFEEFVTDVKKIRSENKIFELDDILDKIKENGVTSLTEEELKFLDNHNKNN